LLLLAIDKSHGAASSLEQLHLLMWALRFPSDRSAFLAWWKGDSRTGPIASARFDPFLDRVLTIAIADDLVFRSGHRWTLTTSGKDLVTAVKSDETLMKNEKAFLQDLGGKVTRVGVRRRMPT
jgi:hypothetical protein